MTVTAGTLVFVTVEFVRTPDIARDVKPRAIALHAIACDFSSKANRPTRRWSARIQDSISSNTFVAASRVTSSR
jgi:hypothetical protein